MVRPLPDRGRGHSDRGDDGRHRLDLGDLPRIPGQRRAAAEGASITACISAIRRCACTRWAGAALEERADEDDLRRMAQAVEEAVRAGAHGPLDLARHDPRHPGRRRRSPAASPIGRRSTALVGAMAEVDAGIFQIGPDISGGEAQRVFLDRLRRVAVESGRPIMFGVLATRQGIDPNPWDYQTR